MKHPINPNAPRGRGAGINPPNRFADTSRCPEIDESEEGIAPLPTQLFVDNSKTIIVRNDSPDVGFSAGINPYRGCEHGCIYCYARPMHEYLGFSAGLDFESKIMVKENAPAQLHAELDDKKWHPQVIALSGATDAYQPVERRLQVTRRCLEVLCRFRNPVVIITKNFLVTRDIDLLSELARYHAATVVVSVTTLKPELARVMEPRASRPAKRLHAITLLAQAGIPVGVNISPVIPGLTDEEIPAIAQAAAAAGARFAGMQPVRLPYGVKDLFSQWLETHMPARKDKILNRIRAMRGQQLNDPRFGTRMQGEGIFAEQIKLLFSTACRQAGLARHAPALSCAHFMRPNDKQMPLF